MVGESSQSSAQTDAKTIERSGNSSSIAEDENSVLGLKTISANRGVEKESSETIVKVKDVSEGQAAVGPPQSEINSYTKINDQSTPSSPPESISLPEDDPDSPTKTVLTKFWEKEYYRRRHNKIHDPWYWAARVHMTFYSTPRRVQKKLRLKAIMVTDVLVSFEEKVLARETNYKFTCIPSTLRTVMSFIED